MKAKILITAILSLFLFTDCEDSFRDEPLAPLEFKGSMWEFFNSNPRTWGLTCQLIERAGLVGLIDGKDPEYPQITFFAPDVLCLSVYLNEHSYESIEEIPEEDCVDLVLSYIIPERSMREQFGFEEKGTLEGGSEKFTLNNLKLRIYQIKVPFEGMEDIGTTALGIHFKDIGFIYNVAVADYRTDNGIVHALATNNKFENPLK